MPPSLRIVILGCAGSGKSTLAKRLGARAGAPVIHLDDVWQRQWTDADVPAFRALMEDAHRGQTWISDGNFARVTFDIRLPRATHVVWVACPRWVCARRAILRTFSPRSGHRLRDLPKVLRYIRDFARVSAPLIEAERLVYGAAVPVVRLASAGDLDAFLSLDPKSKAVIPG